MTITLHWWYLPIILFVAPFCIAPFFKQHGDWDFTPAIYGAGVFIACWLSAIGIVLGHFMR